MPHLTNVIQQSSAGREAIRRPWNLGAGQSADRRDPGQSWSSN